MIDLLVQATGKPILKYWDVKDIQREITVPVPPDFKVGDIRKIQGRKWHRYFKDSIGDHRIIVRVRDIKRRWQTEVLLEPLRDEKNNVIQRRRYAIDLDKLPARKRKKKVITVNSLKGLLIDKDNSP
jgi:hypothetical protein